MVEAKTNTKYNKTPKKEFTGKKPSYIAITSSEQKKTILGAINSAINRTSSGSVISTDALPNMTVWVKLDEEKSPPSYVYGLTLTRSNSKWGWYYNIGESAWKPCAYMKDDSNVYNSCFNEDETLLLSKNIADCTLTKFPSVSGELLGIN